MYPKYILSLFFSPPSQPAELESQGSPFRKSFCKGNTAQGTHLPPAEDNLSSCCQDHLGSAWTPSSFLCQRGPEAHTEPSANRTPNHDNERGGLGWFLGGGSLRSVVHKPKPSFPPASPRARTSFQLPCLPSTPVATGRRALQPAGWAQTPVLALGVFGHVPYPGFNLFSY